MSLKIISYIIITVVSQVCYSLFVFILHNPNDLQISALSDLNSTVDDGPGSTHVDLVGHEDIPETELQDINNLPDSALACNVSLIPKLIASSYDVFSIPQVCQINSVYAWI